jgi:hypothetical protein
VVHHTSMFVNIGLVDLIPTLLRIPGSTSYILAGYFIEWFKMYIVIIVKVNIGI